jgi:hypothetical protein
VVRVKSQTSNTADLETGANLRWQLALGPAQNNIQKLLLSRHRGDVLPGRLHLGRSGIFGVGIVLGGLFKKKVETDGERKCRSSLEEEVSEMAKFSWIEYFFLVGRGGQSDFLSIRKKSLLCGRTQ